MMKILFVCHGNICRSPMAEFIMKDLVKKAGQEKNIQIDSAATSTEEIGNPVYPPARRKLAEHGIRCDGHSARQITRRDYDAYDLLIGMDKANIRNMHRIFFAQKAPLRPSAPCTGACERPCSGDDAGKIHLLMEFSGSPGEVADPWYTGDFEATWRDVQKGCQGLLQWIAQTGEQRDGIKNKSRL